MIRKFLAAAAGVLSLFAASSASAAQVINVTDMHPGANGQASAYSWFYVPDAGMRASVEIFYSGGEMRPDTQFSFYRFVDYTYWDTSSGGFINGNDYFFEVFCSVANGCLDIKRPGYAVATLKSPRNIVARTCNEHSGTYCSLTYRPNATATFSGAFDTNGASDPLQVSIRVSDFTAVPEPATWAMMITGFGLAGARLRRRRIAHA